MNTTPSKQMSRVCGAAFLACSWFAARTALAAAQSGPDEHFVVHNRAMSRHALKTLRRRHISSRALEALG
jgi:hypothetical protein